MIDFILAIFSSVLNMDMRDHHDIPFALPMVSMIIFGFILGFIILHFIGNEQQESVIPPEQDIKDR